MVLLMYMWNVKDEKCNLKPKKSATPCAAIRKALTKAIIYGSTLFKIGINIFPIALDNCVICACKALTWFAGEFSVLAMSPCAVVTCVMIA